MILLRDCVETISPSPQFTVSPAPNNGGSKIGIEKPRVRSSVPPLLGARGSAWLSIQFLRSAGIGRTAGSCWRRPVLAQFPGGIPVGAISRQCSGRRHGLIKRQHEAVARYAPRYDPVRPDGHNPGSAGCSGSPPVGLPTLPAFCESRKRTNP